MIPLQLYVSGFLSYRDPVEMDFTGFDLACISGANGAGKSFLLDAFTWALFGHARKRDDSLINNQCDHAEVRFIFAYAGNCYRVSRAWPRGKTSRLELWIRQDMHSLETTNATRLAENNHQLPIWKPLTGHTQRDTQMRIQTTLRMDYDTLRAFPVPGKARARDLFFTLTEQYRNWNYAPDGSPAMHAAEAQIRQSLEDAGEGT